MFAEISSGNYRLTESNVGFKLQVFWFGHECRQVVTIETKKKEDSSSSVTFVEISILID